jgi:hypothetical protein
MSVRGTYELKLVCDDKVEGKPCERNLTTYDDNRMAAKATARESGWMITKYEKAYCPEHARIRREAYA